MWRLCSSCILPGFKSFSGWADRSSLRVLIYSLAAFDGLSYCVCCLPPTHAGLVKTSFLRVSLQSPHSAREGTCPYRTFCRETAQLSMNFMAKAYSSNTARPRPPSRSGSLDCSVATVPELGAQQSLATQPDSPAGSCRFRCPPVPSSPLHPGGQALRPPTPNCSPNSSIHGWHRQLSKVRWMVGASSLPREMG